MHWHCSNSDWQKSQKQNNMGIFDSFKKSARGGSAFGGKNSKKDQVKSAIVPVKHAHEHKKDEGAKEKRVMPGASRAHAVLLSPYVSEKAAVAEALGAYTFIVASSATKYAVAEAVKDVYGIRPASVRMIHVEGKQVRSGRTFAKRNDWKKAVVTLPKGQSIRIHEGV
jgi:large subunit ribosomal protein L23